MKKKLVAVLLMTAMVTGLSVGCASGDKPESASSEGGATEEAAEEEGEAAGDVTISMLYSDNASYPYKEDWPVLEWIKEEAGVTLDVLAVPESDWEAKKQIILTSGDIPDIIARSFATSSEVSSGLLLPISQYEDQMPNFQAFIEENGHRERLDNTRYSDGNYYTLPAKARDQVLQDQQWLIRTDVFEENDIPIPTTLDEIYEAGVKLKEIYPDSTPITNRFGAANILTGFASGFGTIAGWTIGDGMYYDHDAKAWEYAPTTDKWKDMLTYVNKLVTDGVLDQEFSTLDSNVYEQRIVQGETFMMYDWTGNIDRYNKQGVEVDEDYNVSPIYPPEGQDGNYAIAWKAFNDQGWLFPATLADDEEHLNEVLAYIDWCYSDEAETLLTFGKEGETFELNENGIKTWADPATDYYAAYGLGNNNLVLRESTDSLYGVLDAEEIALFDKIAADGAVPNTNPQTPLTPEQLEEVQIYSSTLLDYVNSMMEKFIFGTESLDNWDAFVAECEAKGSLDLAAEYGVE